jgi:hypothetical protein
MSGQRHALAAVYPWEKTPGTHCIGGWVGLRASVDKDVRGKILCLCRDRTHVAQSVVRHYTDWATPASMASTRACVMSPQLIQFKCHVKMTLKLHLYVVLSCVGICVWDELMTRPKEYYHVSTKIYKPKQCIEKVDKFSNPKCII